MRALLDTHIWLWMLTEPQRLGNLEAILGDPANELLLSAASVWEIAIKYSIGRLRLPIPVGEYVPARIHATRVALVAIEHMHALAVADLPLHHRDPFDRILVAQANILGVPMATTDARLQAYDVDLVTPS